MDDLDFSIPAAPVPQPAAGTAPPASPATPAAPVRSAAAEPSYYDPKIALQFFRIAGETEQFAAGTRIFAEQDKTGGLFSKGARVFLLLEGEVALTRNNVPLSLVLPGETFGEMAVISNAPRSASAVVRKNCRVLWLDEKRFLSSLQQVPEFALMLLGMMAERLRRGLDRSLASGKGAVPSRENANAFDKRTLADLARAMGNPAPKVVRAGEVIVRQGATGVFMFVVTAGSIAITVNNHLIEQVGTGGTFGELALLGNGIRGSTATAETDGAWLPVTRNDFLAMVKASPAFGIALLRAMSERVQHVNRFLGG